MTLARKRLGSFCDTMGPKMSTAAALFLLFCSSPAICLDSLDLAGEWFCRVDPSGAGIAAGWWNPPFGGEWLKASADVCAGDGKSLVWWRRGVEVPADWRGRRIFLEYGPGGPEAVYIDGAGAAVTRVPESWIASVDVSGLAGPGLHDLVILARGGPGAAVRPGGVARLSVDSSRARIVDASESWRVKADPSNTGAKKGWYGIGVKDSGWPLLSRTLAGADLDAGKTGAKIVWYRRWVSIPEDWDRVFVMMSGFPGGADLYVNGYIVGRDLREPSPLSGFIISEATKAARGRREFLVSIRVSRNPDRIDALSGRDGIRFYLARSPGTVFGELSRKFEGLSAENPNLPWPSWSRRQESGWILIGAPKKKGRAFVGSTGRLVAEGTKFALSFWAHEKATGRTVFSETVPCFFSLEGKFLPMARVTADGGRVKVHMLFWVHPDDPLPGTGLVFAEAILQNESDRTRDLDLVVAVHPFPPFPADDPATRAGAFFLERVGWDPEAHAITVDGRPSVMLSEAPDAFGAVPFNGSETIADYVVRGELPESGEAVDSVYGLASAAAVYRLTIPPYSSRSRIVRVIIPHGRKVLTREDEKLICGVSARPSAKESAEGWSAGLMPPGGFFCRVPGRQVQDSLWASLSHLLVLTASDDPFGLPEYEGRDFRGDILPITAALLRFNQHERAEDFTRKLRARYMSPGAGALAAADRIACAVVECYRFTGDRSFLKEAYPDLWRACAGIKAARDRFLAPEFRGTSMEGVLPPGPAEEGVGLVYSYGDCYWALKCLRDVREAAQALGRQSDAEKAGEWAESLRGSISESISRRMKSAAIDWVPYGPIGEGRLLDACHSALGNQDAAWPCGFSGPDGAGPVRTAGDIWTRCFAPFGNGYFSGEAYYPSVAMSVVHGYLLEDRNICAWDFIKWALDSMAVPGVFTWSRKFDRTGIRSSDAARRDLRANAEWICLFRDMLVREEKGALLILPGAPYDWVKYRRHVEVKSLPTLFGEAGFRTKASVRWFTLEITQNASPPAGYIWRIPGQRRISRIDVDKVRIAEIPPSRVLALPAGTREVTVYW